MIQCESYATLILQRFVCHLLDASVGRDAIFDQFPMNGESVVRLMKLLEDSDGFPQMEQDEPPGKDL